MKRFLLLHYGFVKPTSEMMQAWMTWFADTKPVTLENAGLRAAREINRDGQHDLPMGIDSITGFTIIEAESMNAAEAIAARNPFVSAIRIYEIAEHGGA